MGEQRFQKLLALVSRRLAETQSLVREQERLISGLLKSGANTDDAEALLERLRTSAEAMVEHERSIQLQIQAFEQEQETNRKR